MTKQFYENEPGVCDECGIAHSQFNDCPTKKKSEPQMNATNKETPATDEQVVEITKNANDPNMLMWDGARGTILSPIARIDAIQAENKRLRGLLERAFAWVYILRRDKTIYESGALDKLEEECGNVVREQLDSASKETI